MGEADRYIEHKGKNPKRNYLLGQPDNPLMVLFTINAVLFLVLLISRTFYLMTNQTGGADVLKFDMAEWVAVPGNVNAFLHKPWTLLTFMFSHGGTPFVFSSILLMVGNMLWLWAFGYILLDLAGGQKLIPVYIYGGLAGGMFFLLACNTMPSLKLLNSSVYLMGANPSLAAVAVAATMLQPSYRMFPNLGSGIPLWVLLILFIAISMLPAINGNYVLPFAFAGGTLAGWVYVYYLKKDKDIGQWMVSFYKWVTGIFNAPQAAKNKNFYNTGSRKPYIKTSNVTQQKIDEILDKINLKGYSSLTEEEKNILKKASEE